MATIRKRGTKYHVQVRKQGHKPLTRSFSKKSDATAWAKKVESEIERSIFLDTTEAQQTTLAEVLDRYAAEVLPSLPCLSNMKPLKQYLGHYSLATLTTSHLAHYRDTRIKVLSPQSVKHELGLLNRVLKKATLEWGINLPHGIPKPCLGPKLPPGRTRRLSPDGTELRKLLIALKDTPTVQSIVLFALETAMRRGEITNIEWKDIDLNKRVLFVPKTKTDTPRTIPLSTRGIELLQAEIVLREALLLSSRVFCMRPDSVTQAFDRACKRAGIKNLRFHDLRHEATSRLFEKGFNIMEVSSITGHKDLRMLKRYTHLKAEDLVARM